MSRPTIIYDTRPRWLPQRWVIVAALAVGTLGGAIWTSYEPQRIDPPAYARPATPRPGPGAPASLGTGMAPLQTPVPTASAAPAVVTAPQAQAMASPAWSTTVAPGVHVTPLSVPTGTVPVPAGPRPQDSEPEN